MTAQSDIANSEIAQPAVAGLSTPPPLLIVGHGTRSTLGVAEFGELVELVRERAARSVVGPPAVVGGFLELAPPPLTDSVAELVAGGARHISVVPLVLVAAGHAKGDVPAALERERGRHADLGTSDGDQGLSFRYGRPLGPHPSLQAAMEARVDAVLAGDSRADTMLVVVGRGTTDPDANAEVAKVARLLEEGRGYAGVEYGFISLAEPGVPAALERCRRLGAQRIVVVPYFLFSGVLPDRVVEQSQAFAADHPELDVRVAGLLGATPELADLVLERYAEIQRGDLRSNCDTCLYRVALPGFEHRVGAPQTPHDHPDDPTDPHAGTGTRTGTGTGTIPTDRRMADPFRSSHADPLRWHGDREVAPGLLDAAVNVRLPAPPPWLAERIAAALDDLGSYPDATSARRAVADRHARPESEVLLTAGAAEAFVLLARALRPRRAVCIHPSFTEPEAALAAAGIEVDRVVLEPPYRLDPHSVSTLIPVDADLVVLGNPTNPTSVLHPADVVRGLLRPGRVVLVDEAFADFTPGEPESLASARLPGLVVVRSLTKMWGLAGLRVGYLLGPAELVDACAAAQPAWSVSSPALVAAAACSTPVAVAEADAAAAELAVERQRLVRRIVGLPGMDVVGGSAAPFLLLRADGGERLRLRLRELGVAVRRCDTFPGLTADHLRVAARDPAHNAAVADALAAAIPPTDRRVDVSYSQEIA